MTLDLDSFFLHLIVGEVKHSLCSFINRLILYNIRGDG